MNNVEAPKGIDIPATSKAITWRDDTPLVTVDGRMMFFNSTRRGTRPWARLSADSTRYDDDIYYRKRVSAGDGLEVWGDPINLGPGVNTPSDDGIAAISGNGNRVYVSSLRQNWADQGGPFFTADLVGSRLRKFTGMGGGITEFFRLRNRSLDFKIYGATVDAYERTFFFATTAHSSDGRLQIWMSKKVGDRWSYPVNLGPEVNDEGGAFSPYIAADGRTLFFASRRPGGYGGDDLYRVTVDSVGMTSTPVNLGPEINSPDNEAFLSIPAAGDWVYFTRSSDAPSALASTPMPQTMRPGGVAVLTGTVRDKSTGVAVAATVVIEDLVADSLVFAGSTSDIDDRYSAVLRPGSTYGITVSAPGYVFSSTSYAIPAGDDFSRIEYNFEIERVAKQTSFTLHNIFFDYDKDELTTESTLELERLVDLLRDNPRYQIELGGHTDIIGGHAYNADLSKRRADAVRRYLVEAGGIDVLRIMTFGYAATQPVATNDTPEGRQANRRVAFRIISM